MKNSEVKEVDTMLTSNFVLLPSNDEKKRSEIMNAYNNMLSNKRSDFDKTIEGCLTIPSRMNNYRDNLK